METTLLTRNEFREGVFARDGHKCVICGQPGDAAHHIIERKLFTDGGYYLDNGATLCADCHVGAENTTISADDIRAAIHVGTPRLPDHLSPEDRYDKWGNVILPSGLRLRGELFDEEPVQKMLAPLLHLFTNRVKYPRTFHYATSPGASDDDKIHASTDQWQGMEVIATEKLDGECTTLYHDYMHARSLDYEPHPSRTFIKRIWAEIAHDIPEGLRLCGENVTAVHSIEYTDLEGYFYIFGIWENLKCLSWDDTVEYATLLHLPVVPVLYRGLWSDSLVSQLSASLDLNRQEGFVIRPAAAFQFGDFRRLVGKWVRKGHVQTSTHWKEQVVRYNGLRK
jgi:hypothetical protein